MRRQRRGAEKRTTSPGLRGLRSGGPPADRESSPPLRAGCATKSTRAREVQSPRRPGPKPSCGWHRSPPRGRDRPRRFPGEPAPVSATRHRPAVLKAVRTVHTSCSCSFFFPHFIPFFNPWLFQFLFLVLLQPLTSN